VSLNVQLKEKHIEKEKKKGQKNNMLKEIDGIREKKGPPKAGKKKGKLKDQEKQKRAKRGTFKKPY